MNYSKIVSDLKDGVLSMVLKETHGFELVHATLCDNLIPPKQVDFKANTSGVDQIDFYRVDLGVWGSVKVENVVSYKSAIIGAELS